MELFHDTELSICSTIFALKILWILEHFRFQTFILGILNLCRRRHHHHHHHLHHHNNYNYIVYQRLFGSNWVLCVCHKKSFRQYYEVGIVMPILYTKELKIRDNILFSQSNVGYMWLNINSNSFLTPNYFFLNITLLCIWEKLLRYKVFLKNMQQGHLNSQVPPGRLSHL